jgi:hypothetical protein
LNVAASRVTTGNHALFGKLKLSWRNSSASNAALFSNGYATNLAFAGVRRTVHPCIHRRTFTRSLLDAAELLRVPWSRFGTGTRRISASGCDAAAPAPRWS